MTQLYYTVQPQTLNTVHFKWILEKLIHLLSEKVNQLNCFQSQASSLVESEFMGLAGLAVTKSVFLAFGTHRFSLRVGVCPVELLSNAFGIGK